MHVIASQNVNYEQILWIAFYNKCNLWIQDVVFIYPKPVNFCSLFAIFFMFIILFAMLKIHLSTFLEQISISCWLRMEGVSDAQVC